MSVHFLIPRDLPSLAAMFFSTLLMQRYFGLDSLYPLLSGSPPRFGDLYDHYVGSSMYQISSARWASPIVDTACFRMALRLRLTG